jgi:hypothetical protein
MYSDIYCYVLLLTNSEFKVVDEKTNLKGRNLRTLKKTNSRKKSTGSEVIVNE